MTTPSTLSTELYWIQALIPNSDLERVRGELLDVGVLAMTISTVRHFGRHVPPVETYRGVRSTPGYDQKVRVEVGCSKPDLRYALEAISQGVTSPDVDAMILVLPMDDAVRIRNGMSGRDAL